MKLTELIFHDHNAYLTIEREYPNAGNQFKFHAMNADQLEDLESELENIAFQIREFRMKNFPESESIEE